MSTLQRFITNNFQLILGRNVAPEALVDYVKSITEGRMSKEDFLHSLVSSDEFKTRVQSQGVTQTGSAEFVPPGHFYSVIPAEEIRSAYQGPKTSLEACPGIAINIEEQLQRLKSFQDFYEELPFSDDSQEGYRYYFNNPAYSYTDGFFLHSMMRSLKPSKIIEVGSGFSSAMMMDTNQYYFNSSIDLTFIEPYPELLYSLMKAEDKKYLVEPSGIQDVDLDIFSSLSENDILFIDSTHVSKLGSDVNRIIFEVLPSLRKGVYIHFHDIFWPFEYPKEWIDEGRAWNEAYLLRAFLQHNSDFEIVLFADYLNVKHSDWIQEKMPVIRKNSGGNIWLRKIA